MVKEIYLSVCFCVWNEEINIGYTIEDALKYLPDITGGVDGFEILVVDNASTDSTPDVVKKYSQKDNRVKLIRHSENLLYSGSHITALTESKGKYIVIIDGDHQHSTKNISEMIRLIDEKCCDVVFGWKKNRNDSIMRKFFSYGLKVISCFLIGHKLHDVNCGYRAFKSFAAKNIEIKEKINSVGPEIICECRRLNLVVGECVVEHFPRKDGEGLFDSILPMIKGSMSFISYLLTLRKRFGSKPVLEVIR